MQTVVCLCHVIDTYTLIILLFYVLAGCASVAAFCLRWSDPTDRDLRLPLRDPAECYCLAQLLLAPLHDLEDFEILFT